MTMRLATFDPLITLDDVIVNGRYVFAQRFMEALLTQQGVDEVMIVGDVESNRRVVERESCTSGAGSRLRLLDLDRAPIVLRDTELDAIHSCLDKRLLGPLSRLRSLTKKSRAPLTVTAHGLAYPSLVPNLLAMLFSDVRPYDAVICPSDSATISMCCFA